MNNSNSQFKIQCLDTEKGYIHNKLRNVLPCNFKHLLFANLNSSLNSKENEYKYMSLKTL